MNAAQLVENYLLLREKKKQLALKFKQEETKIDGVMNKIAALLLRSMDEQGAESIKTDRGTAYKTPKTHVNVADWDLVLGFVKEHDLWPMLTKGVSKTVVEEYLEANKALPPGINYRSEYDVNVRQS